MTSRMPQRATTGPHVVAAAAETPDRVAAPAAGLLSAAGSLLDRQRTHGNRYVQRVVANLRRPAAAPAVQCRLAVGPDDDPFEREAERVATEVTGVTVQRPGARSLGDAAPATDGVGPDGGHLTPQIGHALAQARGGGAPIPPTVRAPLERVFGSDFSAVRVHTGERPAALNRSMGAEAFTTGQDIFVDGGLDVGAAADRHLLAHELTHVVQQNPRLAAKPAATVDPAVAAPTASVQRSRSKKLPDPTPDTADAIGALELHWKANSPDKVKEKLATRLPNGPILSDYEMGYIDKLTQQAIAGDRQASWWLHKTDLGNTAVVHAYVSGMDFTGWLRLSPARRLHCASHAWKYRIGDASENPPPSFTLGRHMAIKSPQTGNAERAAAKAGRDATIRGAFINTMMPGPGAPQDVTESAEILTKVFLIIQKGVKVYDPTQDAHYPLADDVARTLAHGGRVTIRIPAIAQGDDPYELPNWLGVTRGLKTQTVERREYGTHYMDIGENRPGKRGQFLEKGGKGAAGSNIVSASGVRMWGMDVAAGGYGKFDFNGQVITPDGGHGHMFLGFTPPQANRDGALMIGMESTAPSADSPVGYVHNWNSTEATANPESSFYGHKSGKVGGGGLGSNQRLVDLKDFQIGRTTWQRELSDFEQKWQQALAAATLAGAPLTAYESLVGRQASRGW